MKIDLALEIKQTELPYNMKILIILSSFTNHGHDILCYVMCRPSKQKAGISGLLGCHSI